MNATIIERITITVNAISDILASILKDIINAPATINGDLKTNLKNLFTPFCTWSLSFVILVTKVSLPSISVSACENCKIWANKSSLSFVPKPVAAFALKYCATIADVSPITANVTSRIPIFII